MPFRHVSNHGPTIGWARPIRDQGPSIHVGSFRPRSQQGGSVHLDTDRAHVDSLADQKCLELYTKDDAEWAACEAYCAAQGGSSGPLCVLSCFQAADDQGNCVLQANCSGCDEIP